MITWKRLGFLALIVPALLLLAFGPDKKRDVAPGVVVVEYWEKWTGDEFNGIKASVDEFNNTVGKQKGIFVNLLSTSGIVQKTLVATAGGVPPDLAGLWEPGIAQFAALDALTPLDDLAAAKGITAASYKKVFWDECHYNGKLYALVSTPYCYALYYNTRIFQENAGKLRAAGLDPDRAPATIEELDQYAKVLDVINPDGSIGRTGYLPMEPGWDLSFWPYNFGGFWWDEKAKKFTFTDAGVLACYEWVEGYSKRLGKGAVSDFRSGVGNYDSPQNAFLTGQTAIVSQGTFFARTIAHQNPKMAGLRGSPREFAVAPLPVLKSRPDLALTTSATADVLCIPRGAKHPKEAFEFIAWLNQRENMEKLCNAHCKISPLSSVSENFLTNHNNPFIRVFEEMANSPNAHPSPSIETLPEVTAEQTVFNTDLVALRVKDLRQTLQNLQDRMQARYEAFHQQQTLWKDRDGK